MTTSDIIQIIAVLAAVGTSIAALVIATIDRKTQLRIARQARVHDRLALELEYAVRLSANANRGGSTDAIERSQLSAEALALAGVVGPRWAPRQFARAMNYKSPDELRARLDDNDAQRTPQWVKNKIEAGLAVQSILAEMYGTADESLPPYVPDPRNSDAVDDGWNA